MKRSKFSLSHYKLLTGDVGKLIPITWYAVLPGDTVQHQVNLLIRLSPLLAPVMHPLRVRVNSFFCPLRLIWEDFEDFITGGEDGLDASVAPVFTRGTVDESSLFDYLGIPPTTYSPQLSMSALPFRAYNEIYNNWYRDQQLVSALAQSYASGTDSTSSRAIVKVAWEKDYFTAARPYEQLGDEVSIPLVGDAPVKFDGTAGSTRAAILDTGDTLRDMIANPSDSDRIMVENATAAGEGLYAQLAEATGMSINDLRLYLAYQRYKENRNEFGSRYVEYLRSAFGVRSSDARLNIPEYLGGGRQTVAFSEVLSTDGSNTGDMKGHGIAAMRAPRFRRFFEEHGIVMTLLSVVPKAIYASGQHREWSKSTKEDYFQKEFAFVGDQAIKNREVYTEHTTLDGTFGYQARFDEYRSLPSSIAGEFRSTLNYWHYARIFGSDPTLNQAFIECDPTKRQYADNGNDVLYVMANHSIQARRKVPKYPRKKIM